MIEWCIMLDASCSRVSRQDKTGKQVQEGHAAACARGGRSRSDPSRRAICGHCLKVGTFTPPARPATFIHRCLHDHCRKTPVAQREDGDTWRFQCCQHKCPEVKARGHNRADCIPYQDLPSDIREELSLVFELPSKQ